MNKTQQIRADVANASVKNTAELDPAAALAQQFSAERQAVIDSITTDQQRNKDAWANWHEDDTALGEIKNFFAEIIEGGAEVGGKAAGAVNGGNRSLTTRMGLQQEVLDAFNLVQDQEKTQKWTNTPELAQAQKLLASPHKSRFAREDAPKKFKYGTQNPNAKEAVPTNLEVIQGMLADQKSALDTNKAVVNSVKGIANSTFTQDLNSAYQGLGDRFAENMAKGDTLGAVIEALGEYLKATASNPMEAVQLFARQLPQFLANSNFVTGSINLAGYSNNIVMEAMHHLEKDGKLASSKQAGKAAMAGLAAAGLDFVVDKSFATAAKGIGKVKPKVDDPLTNAIKANVSGVKAQLTQQAKNGSALAKQTLLDMFKEGATEGLQAHLEEDVAKDREGVNWSNVANQAAHGATGGGIASGGIKSADKVVKTVAKGTQETSKVITKPIENKQQAKADKLDEQVAKSEDEGVLPEADKYIVGEGLDLANNPNDIVKALDNSLKHVNQKRNSDRTRKRAAAAAVELFDGMQQILPHLEEVLDQKLPENPTPEQLQEQMAVADTMENVLKSLNKNGSRIQAYRRKLGEEITDIMQEIEVAQTPEAQEQAVDKVLEAVQTDPAAISPEQVDEILANDKVDVSAAQKGMLEATSDMGKAHQKMDETQKSMKKVNMDVVNGSDPKAKKKFIGGRQYQAAVTSATKAGKFDVAKKNLERLNTFAARHKEKAVAFARAQGKANQSGKSITLDDYLTDKGKPIVIHPRKSQGLVGHVKAEAEYLNRIATGLEKFISNAEAKGKPVKTKTKPTQPKKQPKTPKQQRVEPKTEITDKAQQEIDELNAAVEASKKERETTEKAEQQPVETESQSETAIHHTQEVLDNAAGTRELKTVKAEVAEVDRNYLASNPVKDNLKVVTGTVFNTMTDFITKAADNLSVLKTMAEEKLGHELADEQLQGFTLLKQFAENKALRDHLKNTFKKAQSAGNLDYRKSRPILYLADETGKVGQHVEDAIILGIYNWISTNGRDTLYSKADQTAKFLGLSDGYKRSGSIIGASRYTGVSKDLLVQSLGKEIYHALGLKADNKDAKFIQDKLITSLGNEALDTMHSTGLLTRNEFSRDTEGHLTVKPQGQRAVVFTGSTVGLKIEKLDHVPHLTTYQLVLPENENDLLNQITRNSGIHGKALRTLLETDNTQHKYAVINSDKVSATKEFADGAGQQIPKDNWENADAAAKRNIHYLNGNMHTLFNTLGSDFFKQFLGWQDPDTVIAHKADSVKGKNRGIEREIEKYQEFVDRINVESYEDIYKTPFRYGIKFANQMRQHVVSADINFQNSKLHRFMTNMEGYEVKAGDPESGAKFMFALGQSMGIKTDKYNLKDSLKQVGELQANPIFKRAVSTAKRIVKGEQVSDQEMQYLLKGIELGEEKTHSLKGIMSFAEMQLAEGNFISTLPYEIDGITNGAFNEVMQFGLAAGLTPENITMLAQGGMFFDGAKDYGDYIQQEGTRDIYETVANKMHELLQENLKTVPTLKPIHSAFNALHGFSSEISRKFIKPYTTAAMYLSGEKAQVESLVQATIDAFFDQVQEAYTQKDAMLYDQAVDNLVGVMGNNAGGFRNLAKTAWKKDQGKSLQITYAQENAVRNSIEKNFAFALVDSINSVFGTIHEVAKNGQDAANIAFELYERAYQAKVAERTQVLRDEKKLSKYEPLPLAELAQIKEALLPMAPVMNTYFTAGGNDLKQAMPLYKEKGKAVNVKGDTGVYAVQGLNKGTEVMTPEPILESPGAGYAPKTNIANGDAATVGDLQQHNIQFVNTWDGLTVQLQHLEKLTTEANISAFKANMDFDLINETSVMLERVVTNFEAEFGEVTDIDNLTEVREKLKTDAKAIREAKNTIANKESVHYTQFNGYGDGVTFSNKKVSSESKVDKEVATEAMDLLKEAISKVKENQDLATELNKTAEPEQPITTSGYNTDFVQQVMPNKADTTFGEVKESLLTYLKKHDAIQHYVLKQAMNLIPDDFPIKILGEGEFRILKNGDHSEQTHGGYMGDHIYLNSEVHSTSGLNPETLTHELIHAALVNVMNAKRSELSPKAYAAQQELNTLYKQLKASPQVDSKGEYKHQFEDVHEFIAWGLSNHSFGKMLHGIKGNWAVKIKEKLFNAVRKVLGIHGNTKTVDSALAKLFSETEVLFAEQHNVQRDPATVGLPQQARQERIMQMDTLELFDNLIGDDPVHTKHLRKVLSETVRNVINTDKLGYTDPNAGLDMQMRELMDKLDDSIEFSTKSLDLVGFNMDAQEEFMFNLVSEVLETGLNISSLSQTQAYKLLLKAGKTLTYKDFMPEDLHKGEEGYSDAETTAKKQHNKLFGSRVHATTTTSKGKYSDTKYSKTKSDGLRNFLALTMTNNEFRKILNKKELNLDKEIKGNFFQRFGKLISNLIGRLTGYINKTHNLGKSADQLNQLAKNIIKLQVREKSKLERAFNLASAPLALSVSLVAKGVHKALNKARNTQTYKNGKTSAFNAVVTAGELIMDKDLVRHWVNVTDNALFNLHQGKMGFFASIVDEMRGTRESNQRIHQLLPLANREIDHARQAIMSNVEQSLRKNFLHPISKQDDIALYKSLGKTDVAWLIEEGMSLAEVEQMLKDPWHTRQLIQTAKTKLTLSGISSADLDYYKRMAKNLGYFMAKGKSDDHHFAPNAKAIALKHGSGQTTTPSIQQVAKVTPLLDTLASLYAVQYTPMNQRRQTAKIIQRERYSNPNNNGVTFLLGMLQEHKRLAKEKNFKKDEDVLMLKGYLKEETDPYRSVKVVSNLEARELVHHGYKDMGVLDKDSKAGHLDNMHLVVSDIDGHTTYLQGVASNLSLAMKGTDVASIRSAMNTANPTRAAQMDVTAITRANQSNINGMHHPRKAPMGTMKPTNLIPVMNPQGKIVNYRYVMSEANKDELLKKNNSMMSALSRSMGSITEKVNSEVINKKLLDALKEQYLEDKAAFQLDSYLHLSNDSKDKELQEIYRLLPESTRQYARELFGNDQIPIRKDLLSISFGYRKASVTQLWEADTQAPKWIKWLVTNMFEGIFGKKGRMWAARGERGLQEMVRSVKDMVVIKSFVVMFDNILSNTVELNRFYGVPVKDAIVQQVRAFKAANRYRSNEHKIWELNQKLELQHYDTLAKKRKLQAELVQLQDQQARNEVAPLIQEGLLQSIVEDIDQTESPYTYAHGLENKIRKKFGLDDKHLPWIVHELALTKKGSLYQMLNKTTQLSDFASRYVLYNHLTKVQDKPVEDKEAIQTAIDAFINYDIPQHKMMQYGSDMGVLWFFKYFMRIQKVLFRAAQREPARLVTLLMLQNTFDVDLAEPTDSNLITSAWWNKIGLFNNMIRGWGAHPLLNI